MKNIVKKLDCNSACIIIFTDVNLIDLFIEYIVCLTPVPLLGFEYWFIVFQALFVVLEFYFSFDQTFFCALCFFVNKIFILEIAVDLRSQGCNFFHQFFFY